MECNNTTMGKNFLSRDRLMTVNYHKEWGVFKQKQLLPQSHWVKFTVFCVSRYTSMEWYPTNIGEYFLLLIFLLKTSNLPLLARSFCGFFALALTTITGKGFLVFVSVSKSRFTTLVLPNKTGSIFLLCKYKKL